MKEKVLRRRIWRGVDRVVRKFDTYERLFGEWVFKKRWSTEFALLEGKDISTSTHPSIIHMGLNRSASQWIKSVLRRVSETEGLVHVRWNEMAFDSSYPFLDRLESVEEYQHIFKPRGYLYSAFGGYPVGIPELPRYKIILAVRDPRDILVSRYYSKAFSHRLPFEGSDKRDSVLQERKQARRQSVDEFVLETSDKLQETYTIYLDQLLDDHPDVHVARYEDMTADVNAWMESILDYIEISPSQSIKEEILEEAQSVQNKKREDVNSHIRKGQPGDYKHKLSPSTISKLNKKFSQILSHLNYNLK